MVKVNKYREDVCRTASLPLPWDRLAGKTILISGASGLIGTFLIDVLMCGQTGVRIVALGRNEEDAEKRFADYWQSSHLYFYPAGCQRYAGTAGSIVGGINILHGASDTLSDGLRLRSGGNHDDKFVRGMQDDLFGCGSAESYCAEGDFSLQCGSVRGEQGRRRMF